MVAVTAVAIAAPPNAFTLLKDIRAGENSSEPRAFAPLGSQLVFTANNAANGFEPWVSDGTKEGTRLITNVNPAGDGSVGEMANAGDIVFFVGNDSGAAEPHGAELWKTDGTNEGTELVKDIRPGENSSEPHALTPFGNQLVFTANNAANGFEPWISDGTKEGTHLIANVNGAGDGAVGEMAAVGDAVFFAGNDGGGLEKFGVELWKTDGTKEGTELAGDLNPIGDSNPSQLTNVSGRLFFAADDGLAGKELWRGLDTIAPDTTIDAGPEGVIGNSTPVFEFSSNESPEVSFECSLDAGSFSPCDSPRELGPLSDGPHEFAVRALDLEPNVDPTPATRGFTVATPPPPQAPDTAVDEPFVFARKKQRQPRRGLIRVRVKVGAAEAVLAAAAGKLVVRSARRQRARSSKVRRYPLRGATQNVPAGERRVLVLRARNKKMSSRIRRDLRRGARVTARIRVRLTDGAGNTFEGKPFVRLLAPRRKPR